MQRLPRAVSAASRGVRRARGKGRAATVRPQQHEQQQGTRSSAQTDQPVQKEWLVGAAAGGGLLGPQLRRWGAWIRGCAATSRSGGQPQQRERQVRVGQVDAHRVDPPSRSQGC